MAEWREQKQLQLKAIHRPRLKKRKTPRLKSGSRQQQREQTTERHMAQDGWRWMQQYSEAKHRPRLKKRKPSAA
ncbi:unnamed protein product [Staurois parvus]|uniref:Uncharacterized protein n=1 Tax=Staurois parvus TaxID=386267 RepID=A0ABN9B117_9NEOB|nr:unnamed protein product [Staurois parvus]